MNRDQLLDAIRARLARYTTTGDTRPILEPAAVREAERLLASVTDPGRDIDVCYVVGGLYWCRWGEQGNGQDTPDFQRTIELMVHVHRERPELVPRMLADMFDRTGHTTSALRAGAASNEGNRLFDEHQRTGDRATLDEAVALLRQAARAPGRDPDRRRHDAMMFSLALHQMVQLDSDAQAAMELVSWLREVLADEPPDPADFLALLVSALTYRFAVTHDPTDLDDAVTTGSRLFALSDEPSHRGAVCMAGGLWLQHNGHPEHTGEVAELTLACLASGPVASEERLAQLSTVLPGLLAVVHREPALLDRTIELCREFTSSAGADPMSGRQGLLMALRQRYRERIRSGDLDECVELGRWVVGTLPADDPAYRSHLAGLAVDLGDRFRATDSREDLDEAIALGRQLVADAPQWEDLNNLAAWLADRYQLTGEVADLEESVALLRRVVAAGPAQAGPLRSLAAVLELKHHRTGEFAALDEARSLYRRAAEL
ncbi:tetratricopeptide repeat protein [Micromonospora sp. I033]